MSNSEFLVSDFFKSVCDVLYSARHGKKLFVDDTTKGILAKMVNVGFIEHSCVACCITEKYNDKGEFERYKPLINGVEFSISPVLTPHYDRVQWVQLDNRQHIRDNCGTIASNGFFVFKKISKQDISNSLKDLLGI